MAHSMARPRSRRAGAGLHGLLLVMGLQVLRYSAAASALAACLQPCRRPPFLTRVCAVFAGPRHEGPGRRRRANGRGRDLSPGGYSVLCRHIRQFCDGGPRGHPARRLRWQVACMKTVATACCERRTLFVARPGLLLGVWYREADWGRIGSATRCSLSRRSPGCTTSDPRSSLNHYQI